MSEHGRRVSELARILGLQFESYEPTETDGAPELELPTPEPPRPKWRRSIVVETPTSRRFIKVES